ncbi:hypothetical protein MMC13_005890 [Lambiella insularis]|nr:hypothetical protein [Lambiella insularis]
MASNIDDAVFTAQDEKHVNHQILADGGDDDLLHPNHPTDEELNTLRRVSDSIPWPAYTIAVVELVERFSYYGTTVGVPVVNYIQQPLPDGSTTGSDPLRQQAGALNMGQQASTGLTTFNQFWVYTIPLFGAYIADSRLGRYNTIVYSVMIAVVGHIILVMATIPSVLANPHGSLGCFVIGIIIMGMGTGGFKPNISPLVAEQLPRTKMQVKALKSGEKVIVDPAVTASRIYLYFYLFINIGALVGQIGMSYSALYVGFWLSFTLPTLLFTFLCPTILWFCRKRYIRTPPQGDVLGRSFRLFLYAQKGRWSFNPIITHKRMSDGTFWENVKPSKIAPSARPSWMDFDDVWVEEVRRGLTYNQLNTNLTSQAAVMTKNGLPNDVLSNLDPFALIILIPVCDLLLYPALRRLKINFSPIKRIAMGFFTGSAAMIWAAVIQAYIYKMSECGYYAAGTLADGVTQCPVVEINVWAQTGSYLLIAISEILASITSLEYAFTKAPKNMRSLVMAVNLFMTAISAAIGEGFVSLSADPLLTWNYGVMAVLSFIGGTCFWFQYRTLDREEDHLNMLRTGNFRGHQVDEARVDLTDLEDEGLEYRVGGEQAAVSRSSGPDAVAKSAL